MGYMFLKDAVTADMTFQAEAKTLEELFEECAKAVFDTQCDINKVEAKEKRTIELENEDPEDLLFDFLSELVYLKDSLYMLFSKFQVKIVGSELKADIYGEPIDPDKHDLKVDVKAVTMHMFKLERTKEGCKAIVVLDI